MPVYNVSTNIQRYFSYGYFISFIVQTGLPVHNIFFTHVTFHVQHFIRDESSSRVHFNKLNVSWRRNCLSCLKPMVLCDWDSRLVLWSVDLARTAKRATHSTRGVRETTYTKEFWLIHRSNNNKTMRLTVFHMDNNILESLRPMFLRWCVGDLNTTHWPPAETCVNKSFFFSVWTPPF